MSQSDAETLPGEPHQGQQRKRVKRASDKCSRSDTSYGILLGVFQILCQSIQLETKEPDELTGG